ncbi:type II toxin-antitoxin system HicB family antitoxin [Halovivax sp.]|uniref:type II toxin-antitoxin system HicB family antitoxin n=1 Tax=Halovivax sp. TaxID=1935978 RepID=UPI0025C29AC3|nr:type II toxin-antitoxin system HicB family antitoxin [Halovivax sp.]
MASPSSDGPAREAEIRLWREGDRWVATDVGAGVTTQGRSRTDALENLDDAVAVHEDSRGRESTDEELREYGIDPADNSTGDRDSPDVLV